MQPCNRIYYSTVHRKLNMFRMAHRSSSGNLTVFAASGLHTHVVTGRSQVWVRTHSHSDLTKADHPLSLEETVGYVWTRNSWLLRTFRSFFFGGHCRIMGTRWLPARPFSALTLYPWFQLVFAWRHRHYVVAAGGVICGSLISVILAGVPLTSRRWRRRPQSHPPQRFHSH
jgi:hypothetical protein